MHFFKKNLPAGSLILLKFYLRYTNYEEQQH